MKAKNPMVFSFTLFAGALTAQSVQAADNTSQNIVCHEKLDNDVYDYLIFTPKEFKTEFEKLARWKTQKGIKAKVICVTNRASIKSYINTYANKLPKDRDMFVLLGGKSYDESIMDEPSQFYVDSADSTYVANWPIAGNKSIYPEYNYMRSDVPYTEVKDRSVIVSRALVSCTSDVKAFVQKIIGYETKPSAKGWNNTILFAGSKKLHMDNDAETLAKDLYNNSIKTNSNSNVEYYFTDKISDFDNKISKGYSFINFNTHGIADIEFDEMGKICTGHTFYPSSFNTGESYKSDGKFNSNQYTIMYSQACNAGMFIESSAKKLLCGNNTGVVAFIGATSTTIGVSNNYSVLLYQASHILDKHFYSELFDNSGKYKRLSKILANAKTKCINDISQSSYKKKMGLSNEIYNVNKIIIEKAYHVLGDPEMPVYTNEPKLITNNSYTYDGSTGKLTVTTSSSDARICVMSSKDNGKSYYKVVDNASQYTFENVPSGCIYTVTSPGYATKSDTVITSVPVLTVNYDPYHSNLTVTFDKGSRYKNTKLKIYKQNSSSVYPALYMTIDNGDASGVITKTFNTENWEPTNYTFNLCNTDYHEASIASKSLEIIGCKPLITANVDDNYYVTVNFKFPAGAKEGEIKVYQESEINGLRGTNVLSQKVDGRYNAKFSFSAKQWEKGINYIIDLTGNNTIYTSTKIHLESEDTHTIEYTYNRKFDMLDINFTCAKKAEEVQIRIVRDGLNPDNVTPDIVDGMEIVNNKKNCASIFENIQLRSKDGRSGNAVVFTANLKQGEWYKVYLYEDGVRTAQADLPFKFAQKEDDFRPIVEDDHTIRINDDFENREAENPRIRVTNLNGRVLADKAISSDESVKTVEGDYTNQSTLIVTLTDNGKVVKSRTIKKK